MKQASARSDVSAETLLGQAADEFTQRLARGEQPDVEEYARRYSPIAAVVRQVLPALAVMPLSPAHAAVSADALDGPGPEFGVLGDYRLIREIGRGGMGVVYEATQVSLNRRVALKVLSFAALLDQRHLQRFRNEAQAAAQLHHTNIVPVFAVGCERGVHYYAMQYIDGQPLSAVIQELRRLNQAEPTEERMPSEGGTAALHRPSPSLGEAGGPSVDDASIPASTAGLPETLTADGSTRGRAFFRSMAGLAVQAAEALQHAHEHGVIHRDVKPSNLLLDMTGRLWITDFGLATIQADPGLTLTGDLVGTIRYMSPEQALAKRVPVDHRTDVYSLGATLYELLALEPAHPGRDRQELLRRIAVEEPRPLRRINPLIPRELAIIVAKAMAKDAADRYGTAEELAEDLQRFLGDQPILARPPTLLDRAAKWSRRHRPVVAAGIVLLVLSVLGLSVGSALIARQRNEARRQYQRAETNLRRAHEAVDRMQTRILGADLGGVRDTESLRLALQQDSLAVIKALAEKNPDRAARLDLAGAHLRLGRTQAQMGQDEAAEQAYREAIQILTRLRGDAAGPSEYSGELVEANLCLGTLWWEKRRYAEAETLAREACSLMTSSGGETQQSGASRRQLARSLDLLGVVLRDTGRTEEAEWSLRESIGQWEKLIDLLPEGAGSSQNRLELARTKRNLAGLLMRTGQRNAAERVIRESLSLQEGLTSWFPDNNGYARELSQTRRWWDELQLLGEEQLRPGACIARAVASPNPGHGDLASASGYDETQVAARRILEGTVQEVAWTEQADAAYRRAVDMADGLARANPSNPRYRQDLAELHKLRMRVMKWMWRLGEAETALGKAIAAQEQLAADFPHVSDYRIQLAKSRDELKVIRDRRSAGELMVLSKTSAEGVARAVELACSADDSAIPLDPFVLTIHAEHLALGGHFERAELLVRKSIELDSASVGRWKSLGWILLGCGRRAEATAAFRKGLTLANIQTADEAEQACPDTCTAGYFLNMVGSDEFVDRWRGVLGSGVRLDPWPWFYIGLRMELDGQPAQARIAYARAVEPGHMGNAHHTANWAAYRAQMLGGAAALPSSRPAF